MLNLSKRHLPVSVTAVAPLERYDNADLLLAYCLLVGEYVSLGIWWAGVCAGVDPGLRDVRVRMVFSCVLTCTAAVSSCLGRGVQRFYLNSVTVMQDWRLPSPSELRAWGVSFSPWALCRCVHAKFRGCDTLKKLAIQCMKVFV